MNDRAWELIDALVDDRLSDGEARELAGLLAADDEVRRGLIRGVHQHQALRAMLAPALAIRPRRSAWPAAAAVAAIVAIVAAAWLLLPQPTPAPQPVAQEPRVPLPPPPVPAPPPVPEPVPAPAPQPEPQPPMPEPPAPEPPPEPQPPLPEPPPPPPSPPRETRTVVATVLDGDGTVKAGDQLAAGDVVRTRSRVVLQLASGARAELDGDCALEMTPLRLAHGVLAVSAPQPLTVATPHAEAVLKGEKLRLTCAAATRLDVIKGSAQLRRPGDRRALDVEAGFTAAAGKGIPWGARRTGREPATVIVVADDFEDADAWTLTRGSFPIAANGQLDIDLAPQSEQRHSTATARAGAAAPLRVAVDVEFTKAPRGSLGAVRLHAYREGRTVGLVHADLMDDDYWLTVGAETVRVAAPRKYPRRERWTLEVDETVRWLVGGEEVLKLRGVPAPEPYRVSLAGKSGSGAAGTRARFDNIVVEEVRR